MHRLKSLPLSIWTYRAARAALAGTFIVAGVLKLADVRSFVATIKAFALLPTEIVKPVAVAMPVAEILGGLLLLCDAPGGLAIIGWMLVLFIGVVVNAIRQGLDIDCGCYGPGEVEGEVYHGLWPTLWRDLLMLSGVLYCLTWRRFHGGRRLRPATPTLKETSCAQSN